MHIRFFIAHVAHTAPLCLYPPGATRLNFIVSLRRQFTRIMATAFATNSLDFSTVREGNVTIFMICLLCLAGSPADGRHNRYY